MIIYDAIVVTSARVPEAIRECTMNAFHSYMATCFIRAQVSTVPHPVAPQVAPCQAVMEIFLAHEGDRGHGNITRVQSSRESQLFPR